MLGPAEMTLYIVSHFNTHYHMRSVERSITDSLGKSHASGQPGRLSDSGALAVAPCTTTLSHSCRLNGWLSVTAALTALAGSSQGQNGCRLGGDLGIALQREMCVKAQNTSSSRLHHYWGAVGSVAGWLSLGFSGLTLVWVTVTHIETRTGRGDTRASRRSRLGDLGRRWAMVLLFGAKDFLFPVTKGDFSFFFFFSVAEDARPRCCRSRRAGDSGRR